MSQIPEALRLADGLETHVMFGSGSRISRPGLENIVTTLREQHAENERLRQINWSHEMKLSVRGYEMQIDSLKADNERLREALDKSLTDEQIKQIAALIDRAMPLESAKILFARGIEAALKEVPP